MAYKLLFVALAVSLLMSCSRALHPAGEAKSFVIYPPPPDTARIQFLSRISSSRDITGKRGGLKKFILGSDAEQVIGKPYGVAMFNGKIYLCDALIRGFEVIDLKKNKFDYYTPSGKGELKTPINCCVDKRGYLYVADAGRKQIVVFNEKLEYQSSFGEADNFKPTDLFLTEGKIWVTNLTGHRVNVYSNDSSYRLLNVFPTATADSAGHLFSPTNIFVSATNLYVTDFGGFKIKTYTLDGKFVEAIGSYGDRPGQFARPKGIAVDRESNLYVVDAGFENTQIFDKTGKLLMFFGGTYKGPGDMWLPAKVIIDYDNLQYFQKFVAPAFNLKYLILVTNQFGPDKLNIYGYVEAKR